MVRQGPEKVNTRSGQVDGKVKAKARSRRGQAKSKQGQGEFKARSRGMDKSRLI